MGDHSSTPLLLKIQPPLNEVYEVQRLIITIKGMNLSGDRYGGIMGGLANSVRLCTRELEVVTSDLLGNVEVLTDGDWGTVCHDVRPVGEKGMGGLAVITAHWHFLISSRLITLNGARGGRLVATFQDDLSSMNAHTVLAQGTKTIGNPGLDNVLMTIGNEPAPPTR